MLWRRYMMAGALAFALGFSAYCFVQGALEVRRLEAENAQIETRIASLSEENARLSGEIDRLKSDERALERLVRKELGWVRAGELAYRFR